MEYAPVQDVGQQAETVMEGEQWLNVLSLAEVEVSSEDELCPIERALTAAPSLGWRAARPGTQIIRLIFRERQRLRRVHLHIIERASERTQELVLRYARGGEDTMQEVLRQQFNFSPAGSTEETEEFSVMLDDVALLELEIDPDRVHAGVNSDVYATLSALRLSAEPVPMHR